MKHNMQNSPLVYIIMFAFVFFSVEAWGQRTASVSGNWSSTATWGGQPAPTSTDAVTVNDGINVTIDVANAECLSLIINGGGNTSFVTVGDNSLSIGGAVTINAPTAAVGKYITVGNGSLSCASITMNASTNDTWDCYVSLTGSGSVNVSGNITMNGSNLRNFVHFSGTGSLSIGGAFGGTTGGGITSNIAGAATSPTSGTVNYSGSGAQTIPAFSGYFNLTASNTGTKTLGNASPLNINGNLEVAGTTMAFRNNAAQTVTVAGNLSGNGTIDMSPGSHAHILNLGGATNAIGTLTTAAVASVVNYNRAGAQTVFGSTNYRNLTFAGGNTKTLQGNISVGGTLTLTAGLVELGNYDLTISSGAAIAGGSVTAMAVTNGTGQLKRVFPAGASAAFTFPVGDLTGANDYSPVSLTFSANSTPRIIGVRVTDAQHPNDGTINDYITRYWSFTDDQAGTFTYTSLYTHIGAPADLVGTNGNMRVNRWDGSYWTQYTSTWPSGTTIQTAGITEANGPLNNSEFTGRVNIATYTWNRTDDSGDWQNPAHWTPARISPQPTDILLFNNNGNTTASNVPSQIIARLVVSGNSNVSLVSATGAARTLTIGTSGGTNLDIQTGATLQLSSAGTDQIIMAFAPATQTVNIQGTLVVNPNAALNNTYNSTNSTTTVSGTFVNNGGTITSTAANLVFGPSGSYNHSRDGGTIPTATWNVASNVNILGTLATTPAGIAQTFGNFIWNAAGQTGAVNINSSPTAINGTFRIQNTNGQIVRLTSGGGVTWNVVNFLQNDGTLDLSNGAGNGILNVSGTFEQIGGSVIKTGASAGSEIRFTGVTDVSPVISGSITGVLATPLLFNTQKTAPAKVILPLNQIFDATVQVRITSGTLDFGAATSSIVVNGNFVMAAATARVDMSGNADHRLYLRGVTNSFTAGGTFISGSGNQTVFYDGDVAQTMLPVTYRNLEISNFNPVSVNALIKTTGAGTTLVDGTLNITGLGAIPTVTLQLGGNSLTVNGQTNVNAFGILNDGTLAGTNIFAGLVSINTNGRWLTANNPPFTFRGGLAYNGAQFTSGIGLYTFNTNNQFIDGLQSLTITNIVTTGITLTNRNTAGLTSSSIAGTGNFTNGDIGYSSILFITGGTPFTLTGAIDFAGSPNTVNYNGTVAQTIGAYNFYNLTSSSTGARTLVNGGTIGISGVFTPGTNAYTITGNTINFNGTAAQNIPAFTFNNLTISGAGAKTLIGNATIGTSGILNFNGGILELANFNLIVSNTSAAAIQGTFGSSNMIATNGTGYLQKNGSLAAHFQITYPVGSGGYYSPMIISGIGTLIPTFIRVTAVPFKINPSYLNKYWSVQSNIALANVTATFQYDPAEVDGAQQSITYSPDGGINWQNPPSVGTSSFGPNSFTIANTSPFTGSLAPFTGWWTMGNRTFFSYQTGDWNNPATWTSDPSGTLQVGNTIPSLNDNVVILAGRTVSLTDDIATANLKITINEAGFLDLATYRFTQPLQLLGGQGTLRLASVNFPAGATAPFTNAGGGTTEYTANITLPVSQTTYNNLTISTSGTVIQLNDLLLNGNLYVKQGTFQINDNTSARRRLTINGNVNIDAGAFMSVGNGVTNATTIPTGITGGTAPYLNYYDQQSHRVVISGDFTNNGTVRFTNLIYPVYNAFPPSSLDATSGFATVYFVGTNNSNLICNGTTDFYNLVLDKGTDKTFKLTINSNNYSDFRLFGANISSGDLLAPATAANPNLKKALWIRSGTLELRGNLVIPSLTEGTDGGNPTSDFTIPANAALIIDHPNVVVLVTADDYLDVNAAYNVSGGTGLVNGIGQGGNSGLLLLGELIVNAGYLSTRESAGLLYSAVASGQIFVNGGTIDAKQFRGIGAGLVSFTQSGGLLTLRGRFQRTPSSYTSVLDLVNAPLNTSRANETPLDAAVGTFSIINNMGVFSMSAGVISVFDACGPVGRVFDVFSSAANYSVTGGTIELIPTTGTITADAATWLLTSNSPMGNLILNRASSTSIVQINTGYPLTLLQNLTLQSGSFDANNQDVTIGGDFTIQSGTIYTPGTNTTTLNGEGTQVLTVNLASPLSLFRFTIDKPAGTAVNLVGSQNTLNVSDNFRLVNATLNDNGKTINMAGNVYNSGIHSGSGKIVLNSNSPQIIDGDGTGVFQNLELNRPNDGIVLANANNNFTINGTLTFSGSAAGYKQLNLQNYNLNFGSLATVVGANANRYVLTNGNFGDGGITKAYSPTATSFSFPVATVHPTVNYTPATISIGSAPATWGSVTVVPVRQEHPNTTTKNISLRYFWKVRSSGFTGIPVNSVTHSYTYSQDDVFADEADYVPARWDQSALSWTVGTAISVDETNNIIGAPWLANTSHIDGDYTAGDIVPVSPFGVPRVLYSRQSGLWSNVNTWSLTGHTADNPPATFPNASDIVIIGGNDSIFLSNEVPPFPVNNTDPAITYYQLNKAVANSASLMIEAGSVLDIQNNPLCNFGVVKTHTNGNGKIRITTRHATAFDASMVFAFPTGDFSEFNAVFGTTEFYTINPQSGTVFILPANVTTYGNVILTPFKGSNIILPNTNTVTINGDLICNGSDADAWLAMSWWDAAYGPIVPKTVNVKRNFLVRGGLFVFIDNGTTAQNISIDGDVVVWPRAGIDVWQWMSTSTNNTMSIGGSLINNSDLSAAPTYGTLSQVRFFNTTASRIVHLNFFGPNSAIIHNTAGAPVTILHTVTVNKGNSPATTLTMNIGGTLTTASANWLTLQNGTFIYNRTGDLTISTTAPFTIPSTAELRINTPSNVLIGNSASNTNDLFLNGKLTLINGNLRIGPIGGTANNNDIEYSGGGASEIDIRGGTFIVNGQIRRNTSTTSGILRYSQSGGTVTIMGNAFVATNAKLEILNPGSAFNMSDGSLTIVRGGGGTSYGDLYLRPENSMVSGGEIIFTQVPAIGPVIDAIQTYRLESNVPINHLTITGKTAGTARNATLDLMISPLVLKGNLTLNNLRSFLNSNNVNISLQGNLSNSGTYTFGNNSTTFNGGVQAITGTSVTNFYDLNVSPVTSLSVNNNFTVNRHLSIVSGVLLLTNRRATVIGNLLINGSYTDDNTTGGVSLAGAALQQISGTGLFGKLELNNNAGARINSDIFLLNNLALTQGILNINQYRLNLGQNSNITGAPFSLTKMITADGVASSLGLRKFFNIIAAPQSFTYPLGVTGKYTPAVLSINSNASVGYININPINNNHPAVIDPLNVLKYYWVIESSGISNFDGNLLLQYSQGDILGNEIDYVAAKLINPGTFWSKATPGPLTDNVDETNNQITFNIPAGTNDLSGDYTAGEDTALPNEVPSYRSIADGDWSDNTIWAPIGASPPCPIGGPNGFNVVIDHHVTANVNYCFAYTTTINDRLSIVSPTFGHNLGTVYGNGILQLESGNLPAGNFVSFLDCANNGILEYSGSTTYTIIASQFNSVPNLFFTGTGTRILPNKDLTVCNRLVIDGPILDNTVNRRKLTILGTMERYNAGAFLAGSGANATVSFSGSSLQTVGGALGDFSGINSFNNLEINNSSGLNIGNNSIIQVTGNLLLTNGIINTSSTSQIYLNRPTTSIPLGGSAASYINGPLSKFMASGDNFVFPVGKGTLKGHPFTLSSTSGTTTLWHVEFFTPNSTSNSLSAPLQATNTDEYWSVRANSAQTALVKIGWSPQSSLTPLMTLNGMPDMRVAEYNTGSSTWEERVSISSGNVNIGDVATTNNVNILTTDRNFTTASVTTTKPRARLAPIGPVCGTAGIPVQFTSFNPISLNYTLDYTIDGVPQTTITVASLPYTLPTPVPGAYRLTGFTYNDSGVKIGVVDGTSVSVFQTPTTSDAGADQSLCGLSGTFLAGNNPAPFSGVWTIVNGSGGIVISPTVFNSEFIGISGNTYTLRWTISNGTCTSSNDVVVAFPVAPAQPSSFSSAPTPVCQGSSGHVYTVINVPSTTYSWNYGGAGATIIGTGNSVTVNYSSSANSGNLSVTATNSCGTSIPRTVSVTVTPLPEAAGIITGTPNVCQGQTGVSFTVPPIASATGYSWNLPAGAIIVGGANTNDINVDFLPGAVSGIITVRGTNACGMGIVSSDYLLTVNPPPTIVLGASPVICDGITSASLTYSATTQNPDSYSINFDAIAEGQGFVDVVNAPLTASPIDLTIPNNPLSATYNAVLTIRNSLTGCISDDYNFTVTVLPLPSATISVVPPLDFICSEEHTRFSVAFTGTGPWSFTYTDGTSSWVRNLLITDPNPFEFDSNEALIWTDQGAGPAPRAVNFTITNVTDANCSNTGSGTATVIVYRRPETGAGYHIPNTFGF